MFPRATAGRITASIVVIMSVRFEVIPAIDIRGGRCVRLFQGDYDRETEYDADPVAVASRWAAAGAPRLHIVDLDAARAGAPVNHDLILRIVRAAPIPIQVGGGMRDEAIVRGYLDGGVDRVALGTAAVKDRGLTARLLAALPERIIIGIDARDGIVRTEGWIEASGIRTIDLARDLVALGARRLFFTDIGRDATLTEPNFAALAELVHAVDAEVIASGGVSRIEQLPRLAALGARGAIIGRALYTGDVDLVAALQAVQDGTATVEGSG